MPQIIEHLEEVIRALPEPPIIIGHSAGGAFTQILLDHGFGAAGVALNSAPTEGVRVVPLSQVKSTFPVLKSPANRHKAVPLTFEEWKYAFTNTFTDEEARALYERYAIPANGGILWGSVLANFQPGHQDTWVDYHNDDRAPLLFVSGSEDHIMPPAVQQSNAQALQVEHRHRASRSTRATRTCCPPQEGWEQIADDVLDWALAARRAVTDVRITHIGGPTVADRGRRLAAADRPDLRPAGPAVLVRLGHRLGASWPARRSRPADSPPIDAVLLTHDHHADNLDDAGRERCWRRPARWSPPSAGAARLGGGAVGLAPWATHTLEQPGRPAIEVTATPCRHGPPLSRPITGRRHRLRAALGGPAARRAVDLRRHRPLRRRPRGRRRGSTSARRCCTSAACGSRSPGRCATR